jgi:hypothetical protein
MSVLPTYSLWDTLVDLRRPRLAAFGVTPASIREKRCELRTALYAQAAASRLVDASLAEDLAERRRRWERHLEPEPEDPNAPRKRRDWSWLEVFGWGDAIGAIAIAVGAILAVGALILLLVWIPLLIIRFIRRARCRKAINHCHCPDCSYDLAGVPDAIDPEDLDGQFVGPARCPECGSPWPLLPPPIR